MIKLQKYAKNSKESNNEPDIFSIRKGINEIDKDLDKDISSDFKIIFCGVFSSGKTSLINALLGVDFPTGINPKTHVITEFRYGKTEQAYLIENLKEKRIDYETAVSMVAEENADMDEMQEKDIHLVVDVPSDILKGGIRFIDTPGLEENKKVDALTKQYLKNADMCIMCFNASKICGMQDMEFLKEIQEMTDGNCIFVINCMNYLNTEKDVQDVRDIAKEKLSEYGNELVGKGKYFEICSQKELLEKFPVWQEGILEFQQYVTDLIKEKKLDIKLKTNGAQAKFKLAAIRERLNTHYLNTIEEKDNLIQENVKQITENIKQKKNEKDNLIEYLSEIKNNVSNGIGSAITDKVIEKINNYDDGVYNFTESINGVIKEQTIAYFRKVVQDVINDSTLEKYVSADCDVNVMVENLFKNGLSVPEPIRTKHTRSLLDTIINWERHYYTYNDYEGVAKTTFKNVGVILIDTDLKNIFNDFEEQIKQKIEWDIKDVDGGKEDDILEKEIYASTIGMLMKKIVSVELKADGIGCVPVKSAAS